MTESQTESQVVRCNQCGASNRVPLEKLRAGKEPICGRCKKPLNSRPAVVEITDANFSQEVEHSALPVLVDMWAPWCGPCRQVGPVVEQLATELAGRMRVGKLNVDDNPATSERFRIQSIPALLIFKDGKEIHRIVGAQPKSAILAHIQQAIGG